MNKFFGPFFDYIDSGKLFRQPFQFLYYLIGVLLALVILFRIADLYDGASYMGGVYYVFCVLMTLVLLAMTFFTVVYWFRRASTLIDDMPEKARFQAIPAVSNLIITFGEWLGLFAGVVTFFAGLFGAILLPWGNNYYIGFSFLQFLGVMVVGPIVSYLVLIILRLVGEQILAIGVIANNTRRIAKNTERKAS